ncbi:efflux RND transporter periplasmic adaptor subunit [Haloferula sp. BvORR071]|uniref:efflux RND transporter periplasmic adaptor subunit n=1 Tax=Haloferula sp. BvORR071 TaxID=1396141 RepID=UPI00055120AE|nr:efflux RND transporter periplasmic adaptor subunit [Haloferula sp. BvORR071]
MRAFQWIGSFVLIGGVVAAGTGLAAWKKGEIGKSAAAAAGMPEPMEAAVVETATEMEHRKSTTAIGTVLAMRSVTLRNELAGTVAKADLTPGKIVETGTILVAQDVSVEEAELKAQQAQAELTRTTLERTERLTSSSATSKKDLDQAISEREVILAQMERTKAMIARKVIRAPFRAKVGMADLHPGQYLEEGTVLTTLQGVDEAVHVDFTVTQAVSTGLKEGDTVEVVVANKDSIPATIEAIDARVDSNTRSAVIRAKVADASKVPPPGASVQVKVPVGPPQKFVALPVSALRRGPEGDHVFTINPDKEGKPRAHLQIIQVATVLGDIVLIEKGLKPGDQVASSGSFKLREGVLVGAAPPKPAEQ